MRLYEVQSKKSRSTSMVVSRKLSSYEVVRLRSQVLSSKCEAKFLSLRGDTCRANQGIMNITRSSSCSDIR